MPRIAPVEFPPQPNSNGVTIVESFFGEQLSDDLIRRISETPEDQIQILISRIEEILTTNPSTYG
jgi:hypothetical protein